MPEGCARTGPSPKGPIRAPRMTQDEHQKGSRRALGRAPRRVSFKADAFSLPAFHTPPPPLPWPFWVKANMDCQPCRDSSGRAVEYERAGSGAAWRRSERRLRAWAKQDRLTVAMALAETLHHSAQKWWSNTSWEPKTFDVVGAKVGQGTSWHSMTQPSGDIADPAASVPSWEACATDAYESLHFPRGYNREVGAYKTLQQGQFQLHVDFFGPSLAPAKPMFM